MKKIIILLICLLLSGCNYIELNDMGIVTLMGINYQDNNYEITIELEENKNEKEETSIIYKSKGISIEKAIQNLSLSIDKNLYFIDLNVILINQDTINKLDDIIDYLTRDSSFSTNYNIIVDDNYEETIKLISNKDKIVGDYIKDIFDNKENNLINNKYQDFLKDYISPYKDVILPYGSIINEDYIINKAVIFNNKKISNIIDLDNITTYNLLTNVNTQYFKKITYNNKNLIYRINKNKSKISYENNTITIELNINGSFIEIEDTNIENQETVKKLLKILSNNLKEDISKLLDISLSNNSDILGFKKLYYNKERIKINNINDLNYEIKVNCNLDREGLLFNSLGDIYEKNK